MVVIQEIVAALWQHDFAALANPQMCIRDRLTPPP